MSGAVPGDGVRAADLPGEPARHRDLPVGASVEALPHGLSRASPALDVIAERCSASTADANELRDWRIHADFAQRLIVQARKLYAGTDLGLDLANTVYALDSTTIDLCLSVFPWAHFRTTKSAVKMHTLLDLRGNIPSFIHISDGKLHDVNALDRLPPEPGARLMSWTVDTSISRGSIGCINQAPSSSRGRKRTWLPGGSTQRRPTARTASSVIKLSRLQASRRACITLSISAASASKTPRRARRWCS